MEAVRRLLDLRHRGRTEDLPPALAEVAPFLDADEVLVLLIDYEQIALWPLQGSPAGTDAARGQQHGRRTRLPHRGRGPGGRRGRGLRVAAAAARRGTPRRPQDQAARSSRTRPLRNDLRVIAALVAELIASRRFYGDAVEHTRRRLPMQLAAEIVWNQLPPLTFAANGTVVTAVLEPCYDVGGDAFDYAANGDVLHVALFDTVGHGIEASALTTLTLNTYRNARRSGLSLADTYRSIDKWIRAQYPGAFVTAVMAELDTATGMYRRICAGHPPELLLRGRVATPVAAGADRAAAGSRAHGAARAGCHRAAARARATRSCSTPTGSPRPATTTGALFGLDRLAGFMVDALARNRPQAETMRRLIHKIVSYENGELRDDATAALLQWRPPPIRDGISAPPAP